MARVAATQLVHEAYQIFGQIGTQIDGLSAEEQTASLGRYARLETRARGWQRTAALAASKLNGAAPQLQATNPEGLRACSLMLSEISKAETPKLVVERYHARREEIETGLMALTR